MNQDDDKEKHGPKEDRLKIKGDWEDAVKKALQTKRPDEGWPEPEEGKKD